MLKGGLQLQIGHKLSMSPQMQQTIKLLQYSSVELQQQIQEMLETNPLLEMQSAPSIDKQDIESTSENEQQPSEPEIIPTDLPIDAQWDDFYDNTPDFSQREQSDYNFLENQAHGDETLAQHLNEQLDTLHLGPVDQLICQHLLQTLNSDGYLEDTVDSIHQSLAALDIERDEVIAMQHLLQGLDPLGCASDNLQQCLLVQLNRQPEKDSACTHALLILSQFINELEKQDMKQLQRQTHLPADDIEAAINLIRTLDPRPGAQFSAERIEYIAPEVYIHKDNDVWKASLNPEVSPDLTIQEMYAKMIKRGDKSQTSQYLRERLQEARWFINSLSSRNTTILRVAEAIAQRQQSYFDQGDIAMHPMKLQDIATDLDLHESTISRVTSNKYMSTPFGLVEFKFFFSAEIGSNTDEQTSSTATKAQIKTLIDQENPQKPLSDNKITTMLLVEHNIKVARRTIAKYREALNIPPSNERKKIN